MNYNGLDLQLWQMASEVTQYFSFKLFFDLIEVYWLSGVITTVWIIAVLIFLFEWKLHTFLSVSGLISFFRNKKNERVSVHKVLKSNKF